MAISERKKRIAEEYKRALLARQAGTPLDAADVLQKIMLDLLSRSERRMYNVIQRGMVDSRDLADELSISIQAACTIADYLCEYGLAVKVGRCWKACPDKARPGKE